jgi:hypothetical protein
VPAENSEKNAARSTTLYIRNGAGMEDYFYIFAQRHFLYTGRYPQCRADRVHHTLAHLLAAADCGRGWIKWKMGDKLLVNILLLD